LLQGKIIATVNRIYFFPEYETVFLTHSDRAATHSTAQTTMHSVATEQLSRTASIRRYATLHCHMGVTVERDLVRRERDLVQAPIAPYATICTGFITISNHNGNHNGIDNNKYDQCQLTIQDTQETRSHK